MRPDYVRIAELEQSIYGRLLTVPPPVPVSDELDVVVREVAAWLFAFRPLPELDVSRVAAWGRVVVWLLLLLAVAVVLAAVA